MNKINHQHFIINKPYGYLSQFVNNQNKRKNKKLLGEIFSFPDGTMAVGRLDEKSEGLLILTTDGKMSEFIRSNRIEKEYYIQVDGNIDQMAIERLKNGVEITYEGKEYITKPCNAMKLDVTPQFPERVKKIRDDRHGPNSWVSITLREGKFHQVRKMTASVDFPTLRLIRVRIGNIKLDNLKSGEVKILNAAVIKNIK